MRNLLLLGFKRLFRSWIFWLGIAAAVVFSLWTVLANASQILLVYPAQHLPVDDSFFQFSSFCGLFSAVFCILFIGKKLRDGAAKNEGMTEHTKKTIYLSNLIVCTVAGWLMYAAYVLIQLCAGLPLLVNFRTSPGSVLLSVLCTFFLIASFSSVFTMIIMLVKNRAAAVIICILFVLLFAPLGESLCSQMKEPETVVKAWQNINFVNQPITAPNPQYIGGTARVVIRALRDFLPAAQAVNLAAPYPLDPGITALCAVLNIIVVTWIGMTLFYKRKTE